MGKLGLSSGVKGGIQQGATSRISNLVETASKFGTERLRRAEAAFQNGANIVKNKVIKDTIEVAQVSDKVVSGVRNYLHVPQKAPAYARAGSVGRTCEVIENSDEVKIGSGGNKVTGNAFNKVNNIKEINEVNYGDHFTKGKAPRNRYSGKKNGACHRPKNLVSQSFVKQEKTGGDRHLWLLQQ
ncbi:hypothetical protein HHO41_13240 [Bacillus sp. DNRA2]|uniref:hypothetical protein n=1 Tax=Bacillus sp. DNRA2 TaxID=2723053 RepID=UPI00145EC515|nr:hypothetical protein [Bacillus sp. DNRA2]NMD71263.1 hypothetical protein [Bacillus sp. DNRA2]